MKFECQKSFNIIQGQTKHIFYCTPKYSAATCFNHIHRSLSGLLINNEQIVEVYFALYTTLWVLTIYRFQILTFPCKISSIFVRFILPVTTALIQSLLCVAFCWIINWLIGDVCDFVLEVYFVRFYDSAFLYSLRSFRYLIRCVVPILELAKVVYLNI